MPNHVKNLLTIEGETETVKFVFDLIEGDQENQFIDFNKIIPAPAFKFNKSAGKTEEELALKHEVPIWTSFNRENWGTKWNAYNQRKVNSNQIEFETAWSSSGKIIQAIADKFPSLRLSLKYADEDSGFNTGFLVWENNVLTQHIPKGGSIDSFNIYFELNPHDKENYKLVDGAYHYIDEE